MSSQKIKLEDQIEIKIIEQYIHTEMWETAHCRLNSTHPIHLSFFNLITKHNLI
jgi:hypothetical protein